MEIVKQGVANGKQGNDSWETREWRFENKEWQSRFKRMETGKQGVVPNAQGNGD